MGTSLLGLEIYQYTPLRPVDSTFRLLKLLKYQGPELECELFQQSLLNDEYTPYEALSYVWGSNELVECIMLDRKRLWVTDNLYSALQCLRLRDKDRYLWIDAICINQADKEEQSRQVQQMGAIYKSAEAVLLWLGKATSEIITLMEALHQLQRTGAEWNLEQSMPDSGRSNDYRTGLQQLLDRQWFTRVWILQEVANAQKATVCCGIWSIPANMFAQAPSLLGVEPEPHCQAVLDIMPGTSRSGSWWGQERDLYALLCRFQASKATDERDKIYALLGLSSNPLDIGSIDIDYQQPTYKVIHNAITYLLQSTPISIYETLNLMKSFATLHTIYFVPAVREKEATEILFPHLQSGEKLSRSQALENTSQGMAIVNNPSLLLLEKRTERNLKDEETCYSEVVKLMLDDVRTAKAQERQGYDDGLQVIPWGSIEQHVKLLVIRDRKRAILKAALQSCGQIVNKLLHMEIGGETRKSLEESALQEAIKQGHKVAIETIMQQSSHVHIQNGMYDNLLQEAARQNSQEVMALLLDRRGDKVQITQDVVVAAAGNSGNGKDIVTLLLDRRRDDVQITQEVVVAAAGNSENGKDIMTLLLDRRGDDVLITQEAVVSIARRFSKDIMTLLLDRRGDDVQITQEVVVAAAGNSGNGKDIMTLLLDRRRDDVQITQEVVVAAAGNSGNGKDIMTLLLDRRGDDVQITQEAVVAAAGHRDDKDIIALLLDRRGDDVQITQEVVVAAAENYWNGKDIMTLLLDRRGDDVQITQEVVVAAAGHRDDKDIIALLLDRRGDDVQITQEVVVAAAGNSRNGKDIMTLLLDRRGDDVQITQEVVVAAAGNSGNGKDIMTLLLDRRGDDVQITQEAVVAAASNDDNGRVIKYLHQIASIDITDAVIQSAATRGQENTLRLFDEWAKASIVAKHWIGIARLCAAAKKGNAKAILELFQQGVPPDERDIRGTTPLWHAAMYGHADTVRVLLATHAVDVNATTIHKRTPLFWPAAYGYIEVVKLLLDHGAKQNYEDVDGRSPLAIARIHGQMKIAEILAGNNI